MRWRYDITSPKSPSRQLADVGTAQPSCRPAHRSALLLYFLRRPIILLYDFPFPCSFFLPTCGAWWRGNGFAKAGLLSSIWQKKLHHSPYVQPTPCSSISTDEPAINRNKPGWGILTISSTGLKTHLLPKGDKRCRSSCLASTLCKPL